MTLLPTADVGPKQLMERIAHQTRADTNAGEVAVSNHPNPNHKHFQLYLKNHKIISSDTVTGQFLRLELN